jgi:hypothetical protein
MREEVVAWFKVPSRQAPGETENYHKEYQVSRTGRRAEIWTLDFQNNNARMLAILTWSSIRHELCLYYDRV